MNKHEARIILLEDALIESHHMISFLHKCLIEESFVYGHPDQTVDRLDAIESLVAIPQGCIHSRLHSDCSQCQESHAHRSRVSEAKKILEGVSP